MASFSAKYDNGKITIKCDTYWSCRCDGNIFLSKYSGEGNDTISVIKADELKYHVGNAYFTYGDERCDYPYIPISYINYDITMHTFPMWTKCINPYGSEIKVVFFNCKYESKNEVFRFSVQEPNSEWEIKNAGGHIYFIDGNEITIVANNYNDFVIGGINSTDTTKYVYIKLNKT